MDPETTELISRCKAGERQALDLLYQQYRPKLLNICKHYAKEDVVAEDLLHDAFVVILTSLDQLEQTDKPGSWMTAIVRNVGYHYQLYVKKEGAFARDFIGEYAEYEEISDRAQKEKEKDPSIKYTIEETSGSFNSYGELLTEVIEEG